MSSARRNVDADAPDESRRFGCQTAAGAGFWAPNPACAPIKVRNSRRLIWAKIAEHKTTNGVVSTWPNQLGMYPEARGFCDRNLVSSARASFRLDALEKRQATLARTIVCTKECIAAGWFDRRRLSPASRRSPKVRSASLSPDRTRSSADARDGMKTERTNSACLVARASLFPSRS